MDISAPLLLEDEAGDGSAADAFERLRLALDAAAIVGTWIWDVPNDRVTADERFAKTFGVAVEDCRRGLPLSEMFVSIHPQDVSRVQAAVQEALSKRAPYRCEYRICGIDRTYRWIEALGRVDTDAQGAPTLFPGILLDIEARRAAEAERDQATALLRMFTEAVPGVVYAKDRQGRMLVANRGTTALIGMPPEQYLGKTDAEFLADTEQSRIITETDQRIMSTGVAEVIEEKVSLPDGTVSVWLSTKEPLRSDTGEVIGLIGSSVDVTDRKNAEQAIHELNATLEQRVKEAIKEREEAQEALRQSQKMEAVGQLTGGIAHDFNNLLGGISGCLEMMQTKLAQGQFKDLDRYVSVALGAAQRGAALTHRLLAFSRRQALAPKPTDVHALITGLGPLVERTVGPSIQLQVSSSEPLWLALIDPGQLENALLNLCINARDAMPNGGRISIASTNESVDATAARQLDLPQGQYLRISVSDTGIGMPPALIEKAFEPFFTTKPVGKGTGLGLSMVYGFARQSGGQARITSTPGSGTTVALYLPRFDGAIEAAQPVKNNEPFLPASQALTVLIVEDDAALRMLLAEVVQGLGYATIEATDSVGGMRILQSDAPIDLLISDIGLPGGLNGLQMVARSREKRPGLKVLFITGYADDATGHIGRLEENMRLMVKPFALDALSERLKDLLKA